ncbi:MAG: hypothetical protein ABH952_09530 [Candidatus Omnitrophota bacterium]
MRKILIIILMLILVGCSAGKRIDLLHLEMPRAEVIRVMGPPDAQEVDIGLEVLKYHNVAAADIEQEELFLIVLEKGKVIRYGWIKDFETCKQGLDVKQ